MKTNLYAEPQKSRFKALALASQGDLSALESVAGQQSVPALVAALKTAMSEQNTEDSVLFGIYDTICQQPLLLSFIAGVELRPV